MEGTEDKTRQVDVREKWADEACDFTPWLADNLHLLGDALGLKLEKIRTEQPVGGPPYYCDILARETNKDVLVAIENQLEWTDFSHLAQTLIYTVGLNAHIAIWVATEFRYESAEVLNWLNKWTSDEIEFYGVKVAVTKTGDSFDEPSFRKVVWPGGWSKGDTLPPLPGMDPRAQQFHHFFQPLINEMIRTGFADRSSQFFDRNDRFFPSRLHSGAGYGVGFWKNHVWAAMCIGLEKNDLTKRVFDSLREDRDQIEKSLDAALVSEWEWSMFQVSATIGIRRHGATIDDPPEKLKETRVWMLKILPELKRIFDPRLEKILNELPPDATRE